MRRASSTAVSGEALSGPSRPLGDGQNQAPPATLTSRRRRHGADRGVTDTESSLINFAAGVTYTAATINLLNDDPRFT